MLGHMIRSIIQKLEEVTERSTLARPTARVSLSLAAARLSMRPTPRDEAAAFARVKRDRAAEKFCHELRWIGRWCWRAVTVTEIRRVAQALVAVGAGARGIRRRARTGARVPATTAAATAATATALASCIRLFLLALLALRA
jgi:hypothetical protein